MDFGRSPHSRNSGSSASPDATEIQCSLEFGENYEAMQFLIDRGIDMTIEDYRWGGTARGWAYHAAKNEKMAQWLGEAERKRQNGPR